MTPTLPRHHLWRHTFGRGLTCTATFNDGQLACEWSGRPPCNRGFFKAYVRWMRHVMSQAATLTGQSILQVIQIGPDEWVEVVGEPAKGVSQPATMAAPDGSQSPAAY